jgi:hypothetical protein
MIHFSNYFYSKNSSHLTVSKQDPTNKIWCNNCFIKRQIRKIRSTLYFSCIYNQHKRVEKIAEKAWLFKWSFAHNSSKNSQFSQRLWNIIWIWCKICWIFLCIWLTYKSELCWGVSHDLLTLVCWLDVTDKCRTFV